MLRSGNICRELKQREQWRIHQLSVFIGFDIKDQRTVPWSLDGFFIAFAVSGYLSLLILGIVIYKRYGKLSFPYCLDQQGDPLMHEEIMPDDASVVAFVGRVDSFLKKYGVQQKAALRAELAVEEYLLLIRDRNKDKKVETECCVRIEWTDIVLSI